MPLHHLYANVHRESPHGILKPPYRLATPADKAVEVLGCHGGFYSNYPLYLGDVGHVSGTTSLRSPSCALRSV